jgi:N-acetylmuramoyl-L-alanine amidase
MKTVRTPSPNFDARPPGARPELLVLHYTDTNDLAETFGYLLDPAKEVSAHYVVDEDGTVHALVDETMRAWHAGKACWRGMRDVNARSIGIEIQNPGHRCGYRAFADAQIASVARLAGELVARHAIAPRDVLGHSDVAPTRKRDPGELFPWARLAAAGVGVFPQAPTIPPPPGDIARAQEDLARIGYDCPLTGADDDATRAVLAAFQRRYRPALFDGRLDAETRGLIDALLHIIFR